MYLSFYSSKWEEVKVPTERPLVPSWLSGINQILQSSSGDHWWADLSTPILPSHVLVTSPAKGGIHALVQHRTRGGSCIFFYINVALWVHKMPTPLKEILLWLPYANYTLQIEVLNFVDWGKKMLKNSCMFQFFYQPTNLLCNPGCITAVIMLHSLGICLSIHTYIYVWTHTHTPKL